MKTASLIQIYGVLALYELHRRNISVHSRIKRNKIVIPRQIFRNSGHSLIGPPALYALRVHLTLKRGLGSRRSKVKHVGRHIWHASYSTPYGMLALFRLSGEIMIALRYPLLRTFVRHRLDSAPQSCLGVLGMQQRIDMVLDARPL